jgi:Ulp1 family protease
MNAPSKIEKEMKPDHQLEEEKQSTENVSHHIGPYVIDDHDFKSLEPRSWINDNIVDAFICSQVSLFQESASSEQSGMFHMDTKIVESLKKHGITARILTYGL